MKKILYITNLLSPYRVEFFDRLGKYGQVTVLVSDHQERENQRDAQWFRPGNGNFHAVQLGGKNGRSGSRFCRREVLSWLKQPWDHILVCGYSDPVAMLAITWLRIHRIPFLMEVDGGLVRKDPLLKYALKKFLVSGASGWISSGSRTTRFLCHYGAEESRVHVSPFSSLTQADLLKALPEPEKKQALRKELGMEEEQVILAVGQFIKRKGFDILLQAAAEQSARPGIYIVGGEPGEEYLQLQKKLGLDRVHFVGFRKKEELQKYYLASDLFVLPTREDIWGLVIQEAMACGLPVITTDRCVAGLELIEDGVSGYIVPVEDAETLAEKMDAALSGDLTAMGQAALRAVSPYTIENMVQAHIEILEGRG